MRYYKVMFDDKNGNENQMICFSEDDFEKIYGVKKNDIYKGIRLENWSEHVTLFFDSLEGNELTDFIANSLGWHIISKRFKEILVNLNVNNVQLLPIILKEKSTGVTINDYSVVNIIGLLDALDMENSKYNIFEARGKKMLSVIKYALKGDMLKNLHIIRLKESKFATFVSEILRKELSKNSISGCDFLEVKVV